MNLLITGAWQGAQENIEQIKKMGQEVLFCQYEKDELPCEYEWADGVICNGLFLYHPIEKFTNLKYIQLTSAGFDRVPMEYIKEHNITIHNARGVYSIPMAEYAVCGVLDIYKKAAYFRQNQQERKWEKNRSLRELFGKTVCIVGCGSVGTECAKRFQAFGCRVLGIATSNRNQIFFDEVRSVIQFDDTLMQSDVIILAVPLTEATRNLIDKRRLALMKKEAVLINISRGGIIEEEALETVLKEHLISGAVLDVFQEEPLAEDSPLWKYDNVIISPHNSFVGEMNSYRLQNIIICNLENYIKN